MLESAGADSTEGFEDVGHSSDARILLADYLIGELREEDRAPEFKSQFVYTGDNKEGGPTPLFWVLGKSVFKSFLLKTYSAIEFSKGDSIIWGFRGCRPSVVTTWIQWGISGWSLVNKSSFIGLASPGSAITDRKY